MHRSSVIALLRSHANRASDAHEAAMVRETLHFVETHPDCLSRQCVPGHLTGSAWVVSPDRSQTLLTHHLKLDKWLQLGGHADGDGDLLAVARREAEEESGLATIRSVSIELFDVDRHWIPERRDEPGHFHYDLRFMFEAAPADALAISGESKALAWVDLAQVVALNPEESMARMVRKTIAR